MNNLRIKTGRHLCPLHRLLLLCGALLLLLSGCAIDEKQMVQTGVRLSPASFGHTVSLYQHLTVQQNGRTDEIDVALEIDPARVDLVGLAMGQRVLTLHFDGKVLSASRHVMLPKEVRPEDVLENLQLALWPKKAIEKALPKGWHMEESVLKRFFYFEGVMLIEIRYSDERHWIGTIEMYNRRYNYNLIIQSVSVSPEDVLPE